MSFLSEFDLHAITNDKPPRKEVCSLTRKLFTMLVLLLFTFVFITNAQTASHSSRNDETEDMLKFLRGEAVPDSQKTQNSTSKASVEGKVTPLSDEDFLKLCRTGTAREVENAMKTGANVNAQESDGDTREWGLSALMVAARNNNPDVVTALIKNGANVNAKDFGDENTALKWAAVDNPNPEVIITLIKNGIDVNTRDRHGNTALMWAAWNPNPEVITVLIKNGADVNARARDGRTALMWIARRTLDPEVIIFLLENGADTKVRDNDGRMAIDHARRNENIVNTDAFEKLNDHNF